MAIKVLVNKLVNTLATSAFVILKVFVIFCACVVSQPLLADSTIQFTEKETAQIIASGPWPMTVPADPGNEYSGIASAEALGKQLFDDPGLSGNGKISCASCHMEELGFTDGLAVAVGHAKHIRNTQGILDAGLQRWFGWDGGTDSLWAASMRPILSDIEMRGSIPAIADYLRRKPAYQDWMPKKDDDLAVVTAAKLIGAYVRTLQSSSTPFDAFREALVNNDTDLMDEYPDAAKRGLKIFFGEANCSVCHFGPNFSNGEFHDTGQSFFTGVGEVDPGRYRGIQRVREDRYNLLGVFNGRTQAHEQRKTSTVRLQQSNWGQWRTPSLRNLVSTGPYMHNGSLSSLRDVVDAYADIDPDRLHANGESILKPLKLDDADREDLVVFLRSLSGSAE